MKLHHIAYAVSDIDAARDAFSALGYTPCGSVVEDEARKVAILFISGESGELLELVAPLAEGSPVSSLLKKNNNATAIYHLCFEVSSIEDALQTLKSQGFSKISAVAPAPAIDNHNVVFLFSRNAGLIELVEV